MAQPLLLLVDDSAEVAFIVGHMCRRASLEVTARADAELAWAFVQQTRPALVLLDVHLPGASGYEFCRWVRSAPGLADLPIALLSQWQRPEDIATGLEAGADFVLSKDLLCQPAEWRQRLREIVAWTAGRTPPVSLRWQGIPADTQTMIGQFNRATRGRVAGQLGEDVVRILLKRSLSQVQGQRSNGVGGLPSNAASWLASDGLGLDAERLAGEVSSDALRTFLSVFAEQLWHMLGTTASAPLRELLVPAVPALSECSSSR